MDFNLASVLFHSRDMECTKKLPSPQPEEAYCVHVGNGMAGDNVPGEDVQFLVEVCPNPNTLLNVREILESCYLEW